MNGVTGSAVFISVMSTSNASDQRRVHQYAFLFDWELIKLFAQARLEKQTVGKTDCASPLGQLLPLKILSLQ